MWHWSHLSSLSHFLSLSWAAHGTSETPVMLLSGHAWSIPINYVWLESHVSPVDWCRILQLSSSLAPTRSCGRQHKRVSCWGSRTPSLFHKAVRTVKAELSQAISEVQTLLENQQLLPGHHWHTKNFIWSLNTRSKSNKAQQLLYFLQKLKKAHLPPLIIHPYHIL